MRVRVRVRVRAREVIRISAFGSSSIVTMNPSMNIEGSNKRAWKVLHSVSDPTTLAIISIENQFICLYDLAKSGWIRDIVRSITISCSVV